MLRSTLALPLSATALGITLFTGPARATLMGPAPSLAQMAGTADVAFKGTVVRDAPVTDPWFEPLMGYEVRETELRVVTVLKGSAGPSVRFHHYAPSRTGGLGMYSPLSFAFVMGKSYVVLAAPGVAGATRQLAKAPTYPQDVGIFLSPDAQPVRIAPLPDVVFADLVALASRGAPDDAVHAIAQLDVMSGGEQMSSHDFDRQVALGALRPLVASPSVAVAAAAIRVFGGDSPILDDDQAPYWLAAIGKGTIAGMGTPTPHATPAALTAQRELFAVADGPSSTASRPLAMRALGRVPIPEDKLVAWSRDADPSVRAAALLLRALTADHSGIAAAASDPSPQVRRDVALAIGFSQDVALLPTLGVLVQDPIPAVHAAAALALLSFAPDDARAVLAQSLRTTYRPLFINALARKAPSAYTAELAEVIVKQLQPDDWWGGTIPAQDAWTILFAWLKTQPAADLRSGKRDASLDALERMRWNSSSEPRDLYALYLARGMTARASRFRAAAKRTIPFDMSPYFDMADKSPRTYVP